MLAGTVLSVSGTEAEVLLDGADTEGPATITVGSYAVGARVRLSLSGHELLIVGTV